MLIAIALIGGGVIYNRRIDDEAQKSAVAEQQAAQKQQNAIMAELKRTDVVVGTGEEAKNGELVTVNYVGTLTDGTKFDSSYDHKQPFQFTLGTGGVIKGWDLGVLGMKVGGKRELVIPPELGYGAAGTGGGIIPPNAVLKFTVELISVSSTAARK